MKRLWIAIGILAVVLSLCIAALVYQRRQVFILIAHLENVIAAYENGMAEEAYLLAVDLMHEYDERTRLFPYFLNHNDLTGCRESVVLLPSILRDGDAQEFRMESARCRAQLEFLLSIETPTAQNIF